MVTIIESNNYPKYGVACIYFLFLNDVIIYVGQSISLEARIYAHRNTGKITFDKIKFSLADKDDLSNLEAKNIVKYKPKCNFCLPANDNFKTLGYLKSRIIAETLLIKSPYSTILKSGKTRRYVAASDCDRIINEITKIIENSFS